MEHPLSWEVYSDHMDTYMDRNKLLQNISLVEKKDVSDPDLIVAADNLLGLGSNQN